MTERSIHEVLADKGVSIGQTRQPIEDILTVFSDIGLDINSSTIGKWRSGQMSGVNTVRRMDARDVLVDGDAIGLYESYKLIIQAGTTMREYQKAKPHIYSSENLVENTAEFLQIGSPQTIRKLFRALRTEILLEIESDPEIQTLFKPVAESFLEAYTNPELNYQSQVSKKAIELKEEWDGTISHFYALQNKADSRRFAGTFTPYELDFFLKYVNHRIQKGGCLSKMARTVLFHHATSYETSKACQEIENRVPVTLHTGDLGAYTTVLLTSQR